MNKWRTRSATEVCGALRNEKYEHVPRRPLQGTINDDPYVRMELTDIGMNKNRCILFAPYNELFPLVPEAVLNSINYSRSPWPKTQVHCVAPRAALLDF